MTNDALELALATALEPDPADIVRAGGRVLCWTTGHESALRGGGFHPRPFTTDGNAMLALIEVMRGAGWRHWSEETNDGDYECVFVPRAKVATSEYVQHKGKDKGIPRAVAIAAAKALGLEES